MSKLAKVCAVFLPIGFVFSIVGGIIMSISESPDFDVSTDYEVAYTTMPYNDEYDGEYDDESAITYSSNEADSIVLNCKAATINLFKCEKYLVNTDELDESVLSVTNSDGTVNVNYSKEAIEDTEKDVLSIGIPRSCKSISIQCNAGDITIDEFTGNTMDISIDCGNIEINNSTVSESCNIANTLGSAYFYGSDITALNADMVSGNINIYNTMLSGSSNIDIDVGNADLTLKGFPSDYTINAKVKVGEIESEYDLSENTYSDDKINISVLAGDCSIDFYDNFNE